EARPLSSVDFEVGSRYCKHCAICAAGPAPSQSNGTIDCFTRQSTNPSLGQRFLTIGLVASVWTHSCHPFLIHFSLLSRESGGLNCPATSRKASSMRTTLS